METLADANSAQLMMSFIDGWNCGHWITHYPALAEEDIFFQRVADGVQFSSSGNHGQLVPGLLDVIELRRLGQCDSGLSRHVSPNISDAATYLKVWRRRDISQDDRLRKRRLLHQPALKQPKHSMWSFIWQ